jgi:hypothetical protein
MKKFAGLQAWIASAMIVFGGWLVSGCDSTPQSPAATTVAIPPPPATSPESEDMEVIPLILPVAETTPTISTPTVSPGVEVRPDVMITDASLMSCTEGLGCVPAP